MVQNYVKSVGSLADATRPKFNLAIETNVHAIIGFS